MKKCKNSNHLLLNHHFQCYPKRLKKIVIAEHSETSLLTPTDTNTQPCT